MTFSINKDYVSDLKLPTSDTRLFAQLPEDVLQKLLMCMVDTSQYSNAALVRLLGTCLKNKLGLLSPIGSSIVRLL